MDRRDPALKRERGAVVMAHSYQSPELFHGVADTTGDSLALAQAAADCASDLVVMCGVEMAESVEPLAPDKTVRIPGCEACCSLASSITADDMREREPHPDVPVVCLRRHVGGGQGGAVPPTPLERLRHLLRHACGPVRNALR